MAQGKPSLRHSPLFPCKILCFPKEVNCIFSIHTQLSLISWVWTGAGTTSILPHLPPCRPCQHAWAGPAAQGSVRSLRVINYRMVKTKLSQLDCGQELEEEEENLTLQNQQWSDGISQQKSHSYGFAVTQGATRGGFTISPQSAPSFKQRRK